MTKAQRLQVGMGQTPFLMTPLHAAEPKIKVPEDQILNVEDYPQKVFSNLTILLIHKIQGSPVNKWFTQGREVNEADQRRSSPYSLSSALPLTSHFLSASFSKIWLASANRDKENLCVGLEKNIFKYPNITWH